MPFETVLSKTYSAVFGTYFIVATMILAYRAGRANGTGILSGHSGLFYIMAMEAAMFCILIILLKNFLNGSLAIYCVIAFLISKLAVHVMIMAGRESCRKQFLP